MSVLLNAVKAGRADKSPTMWPDFELRFNLKGWHV